MAALALSELSGAEQRRAVVSHLADHIRRGTLLCERRCYVCDYVRPLPLGDLLSFVRRAVEAIERAEDRRAEHEPTDVEAWFEVGHWSRSGLGPKGNAPAPRARGSCS